MCLIVRGCLLGPLSMICVRMCLFYAANVLPLGVSTYVYHYLSTSRITAFQHAPFSSQVLLTLLGCPPPPDLLTCLPPLATPCHHPSSRTTDCARLRSTGHRSVLQISAPRAARRLLGSPEGTRHRRHRTGLSVPPPRCAARGTPVRDGPDGFTTGSRSRRRSGPEEKEVFLIYT